MIFGAQWKSTSRWVSDVTMGDLLKAHYDTQAYGFRYFFFSDLNTDFQVFLSSIITIWRLWKQWGMKSTSQQRWTAARWMNLLVHMPMSPLLVWPLPNISAMTQEEGEDVLLFINKILWFMLVLKWCCILSAVTNPLSSLIWPIWMSCKWYIIK